MATQTQDTKTQAISLPDGGDQMRLLLVGSIIASRTNPRTSFPEASMASLRESARAMGIKTPILVRPLPANRVEETTRSARAGKAPAWPLSLQSTPDTPIEYELIAGERRWRVSDLEGLAYIPALIANMTDEEVVAFQLVENLQREDLTPLEEATGYRRLIDEFGLSLSQVAERTSKSKSHVHSMVRLLTAAPEVRTALDAGEIPSTRHAVLIARLPSAELQQKALKRATEKGYDGQTTSVRAFESWLQRDVLLRLADARFPIKDATLVPEAGSCKDCPKRTGADKEAYAFATADLCLDPDCYKGKEKAFIQFERKQAIAEGAEVIEGQQAKAIMPSSWSTRVEGYLRLDDASDSPTAKPLREEIGKAMDAAGIKPVYVANPHRGGELVAVLSPEQVAPLLQQAGKLELAAEAEQRANSATKAKEEEAKREAKTRYEQAWRRAVVQRIIDQMGAGPDYPMDTVQRIAAHHFVSLFNLDTAKELCKLLNLGKVAPKDALRQWVTDNADAGKALTVLLAFRDSSYSSWAEHYGDTAASANDNTSLRLIATGCGVNVEQVQKAVKAQAKQENAAKAPAEAPTATKQAKEPSTQPTDAKAPGAKKPAALARSNARAKKTTDEAPKVSAQFAAAEIAAALAELEEGKEQAPTAQGNEAPPAPAGGDAPQPSRPAGGIQLDAKVRIKPNATGKKQAPHIGKTGTVLRQIGPDAWDVSIPREKRSVPLFVCFHTTELEVL